MRTIKEKNEKVLEAKKLLNSSEELESESKSQQQKKLSSPQQKSDQDSTS